MSNGRDILDDYLEQGRTTSNPLTSEYVYSHSGHRLLCAACKTFQRTKIEFLKEGPALRVTCKTCGRTSEFAVQKTGAVPKWFAAEMKRFAFARACEVLRDNATS